MKKKALILFAVILITSFSAGWMYSRKEVQIESLLRDYLLQKGITNVKLEVSDCGLYGCRIPLISIGDDLVVTNLWAQYSPQSLYEKKLLLLQADSVDLILRNTPSGISLAGLEKLLQANEPSAAETIPFSIPLNVLLVQKVRVGVETGSQSHHFTLDRLSLSESDAGSKHYSMQIGNVAHDTEKALFAPFSSSMKIEMVGDELRASGSAKALEDKAILDISGNYRITEKMGNITVNLTPITFETGIIQPDDVLPFLRAQLKQTSGTIRGKIAVSIKDGDIDQSAELNLSNLRTEWHGIQAEGIYGIIKLSSLWPPLTQGQQTIAVAKLNVGIPLAKGRLVFALEPGNTFVLAPMKWGWSGGSLITDGIKTRWDNPSLQQMKLHVRQIDLQSLFSLVLEKGITATGKLDGTIPVRFSNGTVLLDQASLSATSNGVVQYKTETNAQALSGNANTEMLSKALEDFHFTLLSMKMNSSEDGNATIALKVSGSNPALYNGKAVELNVTLQGRLEEIIRQNMDAVALPNQLEQQIKEHKP